MLPGPAFLTALADILQACQVAGEKPARLRHSYIYPIAKSGPRGGTLDGARQICLIEVLLKLASLNMSIRPGGRCVAQARYTAHVPDGF